MKILSSILLQNIFLCVQQTHTGLQQLEGKWWQNFHFWVGYHFNISTVSPRQKKWGYFDIKWRLLLESPWVLLTLVSWYP